MSYNGENSKCTKERNEGVLKAARGKDQAIYKGRPIKKQRVLQWRL